MPQFPLDGLTVLDLSHALAGPYSTVAHPVGGPTTVTGAPIKFSESSGQVRTPAPLHGQHTREVIQEILGRSDRELDQLIEFGVVAN